MQAAGENIKIQVKYLARTRRMTIRILPTGIVNLTVPYGIQKSEIDRLLQLKKNWILKKVNFFTSQSQTSKLEFSKDKVIPYEGRQLILKIKETPFSKLNSILIIPSLDQILMTLPLGKGSDSIYLEKKIILWLKQQALEKLKLRVQYFCQKLNVQNKSIAIKNYKSRWGTCTSKKDLMFNWQIIFFEPLLFDYIVAHEVCHLIEMNHSSRFYFHLKSLGFNKKELHSQMRLKKNLV